MTRSGLDVVLQLSDAQVDAIARRVAELLDQPSMPEPSRWLDAAGAAEHLATRPDRIYDLVQLGKLVPRRDGRRLLFRRDELDAYLEGSA